MASAAAPEGTREKVLEAAAKLFSVNGYRGTTLRQIASLCEMKAGSIYYHFESKDQILAEVLDYGVERVFRAVREAIDAQPRDASSYQRVGAAINAHLKSFFVLGDYTTTNIRVFQQAPPWMQERNLRLRDEYEDYWKKLLQQGKDKGEIRSDLDLGVARLFLIGAMNWTVEWYKTSERTFESLTDIYTDILFNGLSDRASLTKPKIS